MYGLYQLALLDICMINIGSVIGIGRFWQKYNRYRYNQKFPYRYTSTGLISKLSYSISCTKYFGA